MGLGAATPDTTVRGVTLYSASAPGKAILLGEHGVNRHQPAIATAVGLRTFCHIRVREDDIYTFRWQGQHSQATRQEIEIFRSELDDLRQADDHEQLRSRTAGDFFAPSRYVLAHMAERRHLPGLEVEWCSELPIGSGLGSGAAANASLIRAAASAVAWEIAIEEIADLAWHGDVVAHGGVASGLDSGTCALGGITLYTLQHGPRRLSDVAAPKLVIGDTRVQARTGEVNSRVRAKVAAHPARAHLFREMGLLVEEAMRALLLGDMATLGGLLNLNQLVLEKLGVSSPEIERLVEAALEAGAIGAKLSGSGGGGIIIALVRPGAEAEVAAAINEAGGRALIADTNAPGVRREPTPATPENQRAQLAST